MTADEVIELRKFWSRWNFGPSLPQPTLLAERDWLAYVLAMTASMPQGEFLTYPSQQEINWAWPDGLTIVFAEPVHLDHVITSTGVPVDRMSGPNIRRVAARVEKQLTAGMTIGTFASVRMETPAGETQGTTEAIPVLHIGVDPSDLISAYWLPEGMIHASQTGAISESTRFLTSVLVALGHRLTKMTDPVTRGRGERRRIDRDLPGLRVLQLATGASVKSEGDYKVEWSKRWMVRGHWHTVAHGPKRSLRRLQWYDPYVKGPEDKPLDVRPTIWRTGSGVPTE